MVAQAAVEIAARGVSLRGELFGQLAGVAVLSSGHPADDHGPAEQDERRRQPGRSEVDPEVVCEQEAEDEREYEPACDEGDRWAAGAQQEGDLGRTLALQRRQTQRCGGDGSGDVEKGAG